MVNSQSTEIVLMDPNGTQVVSLPVSAQYWVLHGRSAHIVSLKKYVELLVQEGWTILGPL